MSYKPTIIVLVLAAIGVMGAVYVGWDGAASATNSQSTVRLVAATNFPVDEITRIALKRGSQPAFIFEREGSQWKQVQPFEYPMDPFSIRQFATLVHETNVFEQIDPEEESEFSLEAVGLKPPRAELTYEWPGGQLALQLGRRTIGGRAYMRIVGDSAVYFTNYKLHERAIEMEPKEWRDRRIFGTVANDVSRIEIRQTDQIVVLEKDRRLWKVTEPAQTRIDSASFETFFHDLSRVTVGGFILDQPDDLSNFGLAKPVASLTINGRQQLHIGSRIGATSQDRFGIIEGRPVVVRITAPVLAALFRLPQFFVDPTGCGVIPADVKSILIRHTDGDFSLERDLDQWHATSHQNRVVSAANVDELLQQLTQLRASEIEFRQYPHELEVATITMFGFEGKALDTVRVARSSETGSLILENGDNVLRIFPDSLTIKLRPTDFGLETGE